MLTQLTEQRQLNFETFSQAEPAKLQSGTNTELALLGCFLTSEFTDTTKNYRDELMDLNEHCVQSPESTYYVRATDDSMIGAGIHEQDLLVLDRSVKAKDGNIVVASLNGDLTVKVIRTSPSLSLEPRNDAFSTIDVDDSDDFDIFGVVTFVIHPTS